MTKEGPITVKKTKRITAALQTVESIERAIKEGALKVGDKLPNEQDLAEQLGVGRSSLREGVRILTANGVLDVRQGDGTYVTNRFADKVFEHLGFSATREDFYSLLELRRIVECGCIYSICGTLSEELLDELDRLAFSIDKAESTEKSIEYDTLSHERLWFAQDNYLVVGMYRMLMEPLESLMLRLMKYPDVVAAAADSHTKVAKGLRANDRDMAMAAMAEHIDRIHVFISKYI